MMLLSIAGCADLIGLEAADPDPPFVSGVDYSCSAYADRGEQISPVVGPYLRRIEGGHGPDAVADLWPQAARTAGTHELEDRRAQHALDHLVRGYTGAWMDALGVAHDVWRGSLPVDRQVIDGEAEAATALALELALERRAALHTEPSWAATWDAVAEQRIAALLDTPCAPTSWNSAEDAFRTGFAAAFVLGADAPDPQSAIAVSRELSGEIFASTIAEAQALIEMR